MGPRRAFAAATFSIVAVVSGCGGGQTAQPAGVGAPLPGGGGTFVLALSSGPNSLDPLRATNRAAQTVAAQVYEPLVASLSGPFGDVRRRQGLAVASRASTDREIWTFQLRRRVRFQNGALFNASAVLANTARWRTLPAGRAMLPNLVAADAPSPSEVRLVFNRPMYDLRKRLAVPQLGIVSPDALNPSDGSSAQMTRSVNAGSGPFELRQSAATEVVLARSDNWWGSRYGLGPALDQVRLRIVPGEAQRVFLLRHGEAQLADHLGSRAAGLIGRDPLLQSAGSGAERIGTERSVRGLDPRRFAQPFSGVWLTTVGKG